MFPNGGWNKRTASKNRTAEHVTAPFVTSQSFLRTEKLEAILSNLRSSLSRREAVKNGSDAEVDCPQKFIDGSGGDPEAPRIAECRHLSRNTRDTKRPERRDETVSRKATETNPRHGFICNNNNINNNSNNNSNSNTTTAGNNNGLTRDDDNGRTRCRELETSGHFGENRKCTVVRRSSDVIRGHSRTDWKRGSVNNNNRGLQNRSERTDSLCQASSRIGAIEAKMAGNPDASTQIERCRVEKRTPFPCGPLPQSTSALLLGRSSIDHVTSQTRSLATAAASSRIRGSSTGERARDALLGNAMLELEEEEEEDDDDDDDKEGIVVVAAASDALIRRPEVTCKARSVCHCGPILRMDATRKPRASSSSSQSKDNINESTEELGRSREPVPDNNCIPREPVPPGIAAKPQTRRSVSLVENVYDMHSVTPAKGETPSLSVSFADKTESFEEKQKKPANRKWFQNVSDRPTRIYGGSAPMRINASVANDFALRTPTDDVTGSNQISPSSSMSLKPCLKVRQESASSRSPQVLDVVEARVGRSMVGGSICRKSNSFRENLRNDEEETEEQPRAVQDHLRVPLVRRSNSLRNLSTGSARSGSQIANSIWSTAPLNKNLNSEDEDDDEEEQGALMSDRYRTMLNRSFDMTSHPVGRGSRRHESRDAIKASSPKGATSRASEGFRKDFIIYI